MNYPEKMMTRSKICAIIASFAMSGAASASVLYTPGDTIPSDSFASTGIFRDLKLPGGGDARDIGATVFGINSPRLDFSYLFTNGLDPNSIRFEGRTNSLSEVPGLLTGEPFLAGYLVYDNGLWFEGESRSEIFLQTFSPSIVGATQTLVETAVIVGTPNNDDPEQSADIVYFEGRPELGSLRVYEGEVAAIEVWEHFGSLHLDSFGDVVSGPGTGFYYSGIDAVPAEFVPDGTGSGVFEPADTAAVPEPTALFIWSVFIGVGLVVAVRRNPVRSTPPAA